MKRAVSLILTLALVLALGPSAAAYSAAYGARNLRRQIQKDLEDAIATLLIDHYAQAVEALDVTCAEGKLVLTPTFQ